MSTSKHQPDSLITLKEAFDIVLEQTESFGTEQIRFDQSFGRILKEDIFADRDFPPFDRVSMDGIAITWQAFSKGIQSFPIEAIQAAGSAQITLQNNENCIEVMTGAMLPKNADVVIPYELVSLEKGVARVSVTDVNFFQNIHKKGLDKKQNDLLIKKNTRISAAEIGVLATVGKNMVSVATLPKIMVISTGDELVEVDIQPLDFQIRRSNVHTLVSLLDSVKIKADTVHITDDKPLLKEKIQQILEQYDVLLFSGAVSKGKFDFLPEVLEELGVKKYFHRVQQRPGKPFWFGKKESTTIFAFPGNPVSTFVSCMKYFYPWLQKSVGLPCENKDYAVLSEDFIFKPNLTYFLQVSLENKKGIVFATPIAGNGSGDLANLVQADAFIELPTGRETFHKGEIFPLLQYRN